MWSPLILATVAMGSTQDLTWQSPAQPVAIHQEAPIFDGPLVDSGWWGTSEISVRFHVTPSGTTYTDIDADSELAWPDPLWHRVVSVPQSSQVEAEASFDVEAELKLDLWGVYSGTVDLWSQGFDMDGRAAFDGLLLDGDPTQSVTVDVEGRSQTAVDYGFQLIPGVDVVALVDVLPTVDLEVYDGELRADVGGTQLNQPVRDLWGAVPMDQGLPSTMETMVQWSSGIAGTMNVTFIPTVELDTFLGDFELFALPLDVGVVDANNRHYADVAWADHPLPGMDELVGLYDFGEVLVGQERSLQVPVSNLGDLTLEGDVFIEGDSAFTVWPDALVARTQESDGLSITYTPSGEVLQSAELVIVSNDPRQPEVRIPLTGEGFVPVVEEPEPTTTDTTTDADTVPDEADVPDQGGVNSEDVKGGCGCSAAGATTGGWLLLGLLGLVVRRR